MMGNHKTVKTITFFDFTQNDRELFVSFVQKKKKTTKKCVYIFGTIIVK